MYIKMSLTSQTGTTCLSLETPRDWHHLCIKNKMDDIGYFFLVGGKIADITSRRDFGDVLKIL